MLRLLRTKEILGCSAGPSQLAEFGHTRHTIVYGSCDAPADDVAVVALAPGPEAVDVGPSRHARTVEGLHHLRQSAAGGPLNFYRPERVGDAR